ncbi:MAG: VCBS repeat-containing protein [Planctomycetales bacterium]|nr:VCBS repeat-containing protein [Planctomycetales bacterium]MCA9183215.1 VCBS repeat-containing protein [Planctomycetales bacterium]
MAHYPRCVHEETHVVFHCSPSMFPAVSHRLFRNQGDLTFVDITESSGIAEASPVPELAVLLTDLDRDGKIDI